MSKLNDCKCGCTRKDLYAWECNRDNPEKPMTAGVGCPECDESIEVKGSFSEAVEEWNRK